MPKDRLYGRIRDLGTSGANSGEIFDSLEHRKNTYADRPENETSQEKITLKKQRIIETLKNAEKPLTFKELWDQVKENFKDRQDCSSCLQTLTYQKIIKAIPIKPKPIKPNYLYSINESRS